MGFEQRGKLTVILGCMFAEKSLELNRLMRRHLYGPNGHGKKDIFLFFPNLVFLEQDEVKARRMYHSRTGLGVPEEFKVKGVEAVDDLLVMMASAKPSVIGIDEVQFFEYLIDGEIMRLVIEELLERGHIIYAAGLSTDFRGEPFGSIDDRGWVVPRMPLISWLAIKADQLERLYAVCEVCGGEATRTQRLENGQPADWFSATIVLDVQNERGYSYEPRCAQCHVSNRPKFTLRRYT